ncbi:uncharacterized protein LOC105199457 isoform X2 [Solenopsis invicta]|uniref:uncharacterized protein LOC105199457 isoform X2 n=1 Tax=Solenopsis invicta TaxID=13686 RepID=UPI00193CEDF7|nr:uncharacterized protein LOC105199457 isoform X2 [Solenopsis invicta]
MEPRDRYYDISKRYLRWIGQWPSQKPKESLFFFIFILFFDANVIVAQVARFFVCDNMQCIFETLPPHLLAVIVPVKIFVYRFNRRKIKHLTDRLFLDWNMLKTEKERDIMRKYAATGRWYVSIYGLYIYISTVSFTSTSLAPRILDIVFPLNTSRPIMLPYPAYYYVDENEYFYYIFLHMIISSTIIVTAIVAHDCMFFTYIEHNCALFAIVRYRFDQVSRERSNMEKSAINYPDYMYHKNVAISVYAHQKALQYAKLLEDTFSIAFAIQLLLITLCLSITLVQLSSQLHDSAEALRYIVFIMAQLFHLFCFSFQGQKLINHSLETCDDIYHSLWYKIPVKEQRMLLFVMRKSIEATALTAGKIYVFSLENFTTIKSLTDHLRNDWKKLKGAEEYKIMKKYAANARLFSLTICLWYYIGCILFLLSGLAPDILNAVLRLNESRPSAFPYPAYYFGLDNEKYLFYIYFHMFVCCEIIITVSIAHDCMLLVYVEHACSIFAVAGFRFEILSRTNCGNKMNNSLNAYNQKIAKSVYAHWRALNFANLLENTFYVAFTVQITIIIVAMSITLLQVAVQVNKITELMRYSLYFLSQLIHLFCYSLEGQKLVDHSVEIRDRIYNSFWYNIPVKSQRLLLYVMRRSMKPNSLSAGKIFVFCLKSFTTVLQSSVSYFTVLESFQ